MLLSLPYFFSPNQTTVFPLCSQITCSLVCFALPAVTDLCSLGLTLYHRHCLLSACSLSREKRRWGWVRSRKGRDIRPGAVCTCFLIGRATNILPFSFSPSSFSTHFFIFHILQIKTLLAFPTLPLDSCFFLPCFPALTFILFHHSREHWQSTAPKTKKKPSQFSEVVIYL